MICAFHASRSCSLQGYWRGHLPEVLFLLLFNQILESLGGAFGNDELIRQPFVKLLLIFFYHAFLFHLHLQEPFDQLFLSLLLLLDPCLNLLRVFGAAGGLGEHAVSGGDVLAGLVDLVDLLLDVVLEFKVGRSHFLSLLFVVPFVTGDLLDIRFFLANSCLFEIFQFVEVPFHRLLFGSCVFFLA